MQKKYQQEYALKASGLGLGVGLIVSWLVAFIQWSIATEASFKWNLTLLFALLFMIFGFGLGYKLGEKKRAKLKYTAIGIAVGSILGAIVGFVWGFIIYVNSSTAVLNGYLILYFSLISTAAFTITGFLIGISRDVRTVANGSTYFDDLDIHSISVAVDKFTRAFNILLKSIDDLHDEKTRLLDIDKLHREKELNLKRDEEYNSLDERSRGNPIYEIASKLKTGGLPSGSDRNILWLSEYLWVGEAKMDDEISVPIVVPFIGHGNLLIATVDNSNYISIVRYLILDTLKNTAPNQLQIIGYDPALTGALSAFSKLENGIMLNVYYSDNDFEEFLQEIINTNGKNMKLSMGEDGGITSLRKRVGIPEGEIKVVVMVDFPKGITNHRKATFLDVLSASPLNGVSFIMIGSKELIEEGKYTLNDVDFNTNRFYECDNNFSWLNYGVSDVHLYKENTTGKISDDVNTILKQAREETPAIINLHEIEDLAQEWNCSSADELTFVLGEQKCDIIELNLADEQVGSNAVITGASGRGKSNLLTVIIHSLCSRYSPEELSLYLLDFKDGMMLYPFSNKDKEYFLPHAKVLGLGSDRLFGLEVLKYLEEECSRRSKIMKPFNKISTYRLTTKKKLSRIVLIIDEFHVLLKQDDMIGKDAAISLESLSRKGRAFGIHIILASHKISEVSTLMKKSEDGIFNQFPIRIAFKNTLTESYATLSQGNDAASNLRFMGEAVLNKEYGKAERNDFFLAAFADDTKLDEFRRNWFNRVREAAKPPTIYEDNEIPRFEDEKVLNVINNIRSNVTMGGERKCFIGIPFSVEKMPLGIPFGNTPGRNIALLGSGVSEGVDDIDNSDIRISIMQSIAVSLALQHPSGDAFFVMFDNLDEGVYKRNGMIEWLTFMEELNFPVKIIKESSLTSYLIDLHERLLGQDKIDKSLYIFSFAMDRSSSISREILGQKTGLSYLKEILNIGAASKVHFIIAWTSVFTYETHMNRGGYDGMFETKIILHLEESLIKRVLHNPLISWTNNGNKVLVSDSTGLDTLNAVIPFSSLDNAARKKISEFNWS